MAILKGFPPSNTISPTTYLPDREGVATVIDVRDRSKCGRVRLDFGSWATPALVSERGNLFVPPVGTKVKWAAYSHTKMFYYYWLPSEKTVPVPAKD